MTFRSKKGTLAVKQPEFKKVEATLRGGVALISQRIELIAVELVMDYELDGVKLTAGKDKVLLKGDSGLAAWAKQVLNYSGKEFVLCPEPSVVGVEFGE